MTACRHSEGNVPDTQLVLKTSRRRVARGPERHRRNSFGMLSGPAALPVGSECKVEESSWGVIAGLIIWPVCGEGGGTGGGTGSGRPSVV